MVTKRGHPPRLVNAYAENWSVDWVDDLPDMRGLYILYDKHYRPLYCGVAGKGRSKVKGRLRHHKRERYLGAKMRYFSVYDINRGLMRQVETLILHALGGRHVLRWNKNLGRFLRTAVEYR